eukprot:3733352-Rhodomonas_salina.4
MHSPHHLGSIQPHPPPQPTQPYPVSLLLLPCSLAARRDHAQQGGHAVLQRVKEIEGRGKR